MTTINSRQQREVPATVRDASRVLPIILELRPGDPCMYLRQKGRRNGYALPFDAAYYHAARLSVLAARDARAHPRGRGKRPR